MSVLKDFNHNMLKNYGTKHIQTTHKKLWDDFYGTEKPIGWFKFSIESFKHFEHNTLKKSETIF